MSREHCIRLRELEGVLPANEMENFGATHMVRIGKREAALVAGPLRLPRMGHQVTVASQTFEVMFSFEERLDLVNLSGRFWLRSTTQPVDQWKDAFGVEILRLPVMPESWRASRPPSPRASRNPGSSAK